MTQNYELALSEYRGKITGFSYITFVKNDTFYYGIKRIKATRENGQLVVEDEEMLMNNYPQRPDKGVHLINYFPLIQGDSVLDLNGTWKTTESKRHRFYSIGGNLSLKKDNDSTKSALINHLKELNIIHYQKENAVARTEIKHKPKEITSAQKAGNDIALKKETPRNDVKEQETKSSGESPAPITQKETIAAVKTKPNEGIAAKSQTVSATMQNQKKPVAKQTSADEVRSSQSNQMITQATAKPEVKPQTATPDLQKSAAVSSPAEKVKPQAGAEIKSNNQKQTTVQATTTINPEVKTEVTLASSVLEKRATNTLQTVTVSSDSLVLSFYDNGVVDGDSISVYVNNENIISKVKLTEVAAKKTIYTKENLDEIKVTLVAESLGSIPPNTGLLIIQDGAQRYNIRFSADMETNASVIIKKKP